MIFDSHNYAEEYDEAIFSPQSKSMKELALLPGHHYCIACSGNTVLGTVGAMHP